MFQKPASQICAFSLALCGSFALADDTPKTYSGFYSIEKLDMHHIEFGDFKIREFSDDDDKRAIAFPVGFWEGTKIWNYIKASKEPFIRFSSDTLPTSDLQRCLGLEFNDEVIKFDKIPPKYHVFIENIDAENLNQALDTNCIFSTTPEIRRAIGLPEPK